MTQTGTSAAAHTVSASSNRLNSVGGSLPRTYTYATAGNATGYGGLTFAYEESGRLKSVTNGGITTTYTLNALGQRVRKSNTSSTRLFVYDEAGHLLGEYDGSGNLIQEIVWLNDIPIAALRPSGSGVSVLYVHSDHLGTPRRLSRPADNVVVWRWDSDPFGTAAPDEDPDGDSAATVFSLRFPGQYFDGESGLNYNYFRDYDPYTGRYLQSDPIGLAGGINTYSHANGRPTLEIDPNAVLTQKRGRLYLQTQCANKRRSSDPASAIKHLEICYLLINAKSTAIDDPVPAQYQAFSSRFGVNPMGRRLGAGGFRSCRIAESMAAMA